MADGRSDAPRRFVFERDSFAFPNELIWEYRFDNADGKMSFQPRQPRPDYAHRCFVLTRAARQFLYHARFEPGREMADDATCRRLVRQTMSRNPRRPCAPGQEIVFAGFASLREFSAAREALLKQECGGAWRSYVLRSHWRMVFPISRSHQQRAADSLAHALGRGLSPMIHLVRFPALTINHGMILFAAAAKPDCWDFSAYDPNDPSRPAIISFDKSSRHFSLPANAYWAGGHLDVIEIFRSWFL